MRYALAVLLLLAILSVAGCGPGAASTTTSAAAPATASPTTAPAPSATTAPAGQLAWKFKAGDRAGDPAVSGGLVYVVGNDGKNPEDKRYAATLHAVDAASGAERWKYTMVGDSVDASPAVSGGLVYVGGQDGFLYALDAASGAERWKQKTGLELELTSPVVSGGLVYVVGTGYICALDAASGAERWRSQSGAPLFSSPSSLGAWCTWRAVATRARSRQGASMPWTRPAAPSAGSSTSWTAAFRSSREAWCMWGTLIVISTR